MLLSPEEGGAIENGPMAWLHKPGLILGSAASTAFYYIDRRGPSHGEQTSSCKKKKLDYKGGFSEV